MRASDSAPGHPSPDYVAPELDLRLAAPALGVWGSVLWVLHHSAITGAVLAVVGVIVGAVAVYCSVRLGRCPNPDAGRFVWLSHRSVALLVVATACAGVVLGAGATTLRTAAHDIGPVTALAAQRGAVGAVLQLTDDPRGVGTTSGGVPTYLLRATVLTVWSCDGAPISGAPKSGTPSEGVPGSGSDPSRCATPPEGRGSVAGGARVVAFARNAAWQGLLPGQRVVATGVLAPDTRADLTVATLSVSGEPRLLGEPVWYQRTAGSLREGLRDAAGVVPSPAGGLIPALAVGDTSLLDSQLVEQFQLTGMTHLTAVSGANLALVIGAVLLVARRSGLGLKSCVVLAVVAMIGFVILARPSPSVLRAAVMAGIGLVALAAGRSRAAFPALAVAVIGLLSFDPALAVSPGFALSVFATAGLVLLAPSWSRSLRRRGVPRAAADALAVTAAAQLACSPMIAALSGSVSLIAVPANLLASLAVGPLTVLGVLSGLVSVVPGVGEAAAICLAWLAGWPARWLVAIAEHGAGVQYAEVSWPAGLRGAVLLAVLTVVIATALRYRACRWSAAAIVAGLLLVMLPMQVAHRPWPPDGWVMVVCDVGQGDAAVVRVGPTSAIVIDAGHDPSLVHRCLTRLQISHVPLFVLSHPHADHVGGVSGVSRGRRVETVLAGDTDSPGSTEPVAGYRRFTRWVDDVGATKLPALSAAPGSRHQVGEVTVSVLGPAQPLLGTRSDANNNSLVLVVRVAGVSVLFPGDVENAAQLELIGAGVVPEVDVLKVPHHGSAYTEPEFLDAASPRAALVSVGADNDYGHPSDVVLRKLRSGGAHVARTDQLGDIAVVAGPDGVTVAHHGTR